DVLAPVAPEISARHRLCHAAERRLPELLARLRVERPEARVVGRADEDEAAGRGNRAAVAGTARVALAFGQALGHAKRHAPGELAGVDVDSGEIAPRRLLAHELL